MLPASIIRDDVDVDRRLYEQFGTDRADWITVVQAVVGARRDTTAFDPANAEGLFAYIFGTRAVRELLVARGYEPCRRDKVEATYSASRAVKVIYQSADRAGEESYCPRAISTKGPASERIIEASQPSLFPEWDEEERRLIDAARAEEAAETWYFMTSVDGDDVRAELSRPYPLLGGQFSGFSERIFILEPGDWSKFAGIDVEGGGPAPDFEISVTRKR